MHVIQFKNGKKLHLVQYLLSSDYTICNKKIPPNSMIHSRYPQNKNIGFCNKCYEFIGRYMVVNFLGMEFFEGQSSIATLTKGDSEKEGIKIK